MTLVNELFFPLFSLLIILTVIWFVRSAAAYKKWVNAHYAAPETALPKENR